MDRTRRAIDQPAQPTFSELFTPKLATVLREGYTSEHFKADAIAGLTVAIIGGFLVASPQTRRMLINHGIKRPLVTYAASIRDAQAQLKNAAPGEV
ncbi:MAG: hypothetical protein E5X67_21170 [Mesorhizobium sp.]|uniref:hypothetical protein n=1 Tax=Mesorhizobium sp. TaxID=1871066 RepID=UPI00120E8D0E|nr:hypothetical protein [Mesorhizobium sp.]TIP26273.1 MAG: hypothetical protein E5X67_21170 [Mesorhizobium sp.]